MTNGKQVNIGGEAVDVLDSIIADVEKATGMKFSYTKAILLLAGKIKLNGIVNLYLSEVNYVRKN